ncbi:hypothetical protein V8G54_007128 [Vigna mungo]|uniref:Uncharacterized protein n=1 Tax=Vigna mungo TaxID=3915 RepID=A0AAQ3P2U9_VIGMU
MWRRSFSRFAIRASGLGFLTRSFSRVEGKRFAALWGNGDYGRLGLGNLNSQWKPVVCTALGNENLKAIACGGAHTLFLTGMPWIFSWVHENWNISNNCHHWAIGLDDTICRCIKLVMSQMTIEEGSQYCLPFADDGCVYATGLNDFGQLGVSESKHYSVMNACPLDISRNQENLLRQRHFWISQEPLRVFGEEKKIVHISAGYNHSCAITGRCICMVDFVLLGHVTIGPTYWIVREEKKLENLELSMRGLETKIEAVRKGLQELPRKMEERARQSEENSDGSQAYVNGKKENQRKEEEGERDGGCHEEQPNWRKGVELPIFDRVDPLNRSVEFWKRNAKNRSWEGLKEAMVIRFIEGNTRSVFERLAASKQSRIGEEYVQAPNRKELLEPNGSELTNSNVRELAEPNGSRLLDPNVKRTYRAEQERTARTNREELTGRKNEGFGRKGRWKNQCHGENKEFIEVVGHRKEQGAVVFDTSVEGRERHEVLKDIEDHFLKTYDSGKRVNRILNEEWKTLEEVLPPPKPPYLNWRTTISEYWPYDNTRMKRSQEIKFHSSNL